MRSGGAEEPGSVCWESRTAWLAIESVCAAGTNCSVPAVADFAPVAGWAKDWSSAAWQQFCWQPSLETAGAMGQSVLIWPDDIWDI